MKVFRSKLAAGFTLVEIMIVVLIIGILLAIAIPNFVSARESARAKACVGNLKQIDSASQQYAMDNKLSSTAVVGSGGNSAVSLLQSSGYLRSVPSCPESGTYYAATSLTLSPYCSISTGTGGTGAGSQSGTDYAVAGKYYHGL